MATKTPTSEITALFGNASTPATTSQVVAGSLSSLTGASGGSSGQNSAMTQQLATISDQLQQLQTINQTQIDQMQLNTDALTQNTSGKGQRRRRRRVRQGAASRAYSGSGWD